MRDFKLKLGNLRKVTDLQKEKQTASMLKKRVLSQQENSKSGISGTQINKEPVEERELGSAEVCFLPYINRSNRF